MASASSKSEKAKLVEAIFAEFDSLGFGFTREQIISAANSLIETFRTAEEGEHDIYEWIKKDNFTMLVEHIVNNNEKQPNCQGQEPPQMESRKKSNESNVDLAKGLMLVKNGNLLAERRLTKEDGKLAGSSKLPCKNAIKREHAKIANNNMLNKASELSAKKCDFHTSLHDSVAKASGKVLPSSEKSRGLQKISSTTVTAKNQRYFGDRITSEISVPQKNRLSCRRKAAQLGSGDSSYLLSKVNEQKCNHDHKVSCRSPSKETMSEGVGTSIKAHKKFKEKICHDQVSNYVPSMHKNSREIASKEHYLSQKSEGCLLENAEGSDLNQHKKKNYLSSKSIAEQNKNVSAHVMTSKKSIDGNCKSKISHEPEANKIRYLNLKDAVNSDKRSSVCERSSLPRGNIRKVISKDSLFLKLDGQIKASHLQSDSIPSASTSSDVYLKMKEYRACTKKEHREDNPVRGSSNVTVFLDKKKRKRTDDAGDRSLISFDISRGFEPHVKIPCVNEYNDEVLPSDFTYITKSQISSGAHVDQSLARIGDMHCCCSHNCLISSMGCKCTGDTRGQFAYDKDGFLIKELARDFNFHLGMKTRMDFITECNIACTCYMTCGNRVVQQGLKFKIEVFMTKEGKGWGVRTREFIPARSFVFEYIGEIMTNLEQYERNLEYKKEKNKKFFQVLLDADYDLEQNHFKKGLSDTEALTLDATRFGNVSRFVNHRCGDPNLMFRPVQVETRDTHYYRVALFARRDIRVKEELTWDYCINFDDKNHDVDGFECLCGSHLCRNPNKKLDI